MFVKGLWKLSVVKLCTLFVADIPAVVELCGCGGREEGTAEDVLCCKTEVDCTELGKEDMICWECGG